MFDPRRIVFSSRHFMVIRHESTDRIGPTPKREVWNPLRYEIVINPGPKHISFGPLAHRWRGF